MNLLLERRSFSSFRTIGQLFVDGWFECFTLEDMVRSGPKVPGKTAIPKGQYEVELSFSEHFRTVLPVLIGVPGFAGIRIHAGNTAADTEGCILVGTQRGENMILQSRQALMTFQPKLAAALAEDKVFIDIVEAH